MQPGVQRYRPEPADSLAPAAARAQTLEDLAGLLRDLRRRHARKHRDSSLTYRELATRTGWSQTAVAEYFTARTLPPTDRLDILLEVLGAAPAERRALATARDRVEEGRRRAGKRRGARPVSAAAAVVGAQGPGLSTARPGTVPRQLPAASRLFTGRVAELVQVDAATALDDQSEAEGAPAICAIGGTGGVGKTSLALYWAHRNLGRFPDGQLYADLRGFDPAGQPLDPAAALRGFLEALGVAPAALPVELEAQIGLYRSLLAGRRMLVLLDNARDTAHVAPLLPGGSTCTVLITSRRQLTGLVVTHGARAVDLDVLSRGEARRLLVRRLGRARTEAEPDAVGTLLTCCAGLPLALSIVAARVTAHPHLSITVLAAELRDHSQRLDALDAGEVETDLRAVLSWSSRVLDDDAARAFGLLGIAPGPDIALPAAAGLLDLPVPTTRSLLRELEHAHLVQRHASDRYRMHDLLTLHAIEQTRDNQTPAARRGALRRLVDFYAHTARAASRLLEPQHPDSVPGEPAASSTTHRLLDPAAAVSWFDAEHACLLAVQRLACSEGWDAQVCQLAWALDPYHRRRGHFGDQAATWQLAVTSARRLGDPALPARSLQMLGDAYAQLGRTADALDQFRQALTLAEEAHDLTGQGEIHHSLGGTWERHGDDRRALEHARHALLIFRKLGNTFQQARALNGVGWLQTRLGDYAEARANCEAALALLRRHCTDGRRIGEADTLDSLGYIAHHLREYDRALDYYDEALTVCRVQGQTYLEADVLRHIAETCFARHLLDQARGAGKQALELYDAQHRLADADQVRQWLDALERQSADC